MRRLRTFRNGTDYWGVGVIARDPKLIAARLRAVHPGLVELAQNEEIHDLRRLTYGLLANLVDEAAKTIDQLVTLSGSAPQQTGAA